MISQEIAQSIQLWGYPLMFLLMIVEGSITTVIAAFLAASGVFNIQVVFALSVLGDIIGDVIFYLIGRFGGRPAIEKAEKFLKIKKSVVERIYKKFDIYGEKIIFYVKMTTGLCWITFILAGSAKMKFSKFLKFSLLGGIVWSAAIVLLGYFFGYAADQINQYIKYAGGAIFSLVILAVLILLVYRARKKLKKIPILKVFKNSNKKTSLKK
jgi:membrane protein DedA with SNARE-associated domain